MVFPTCSRPAPGSKSRRDGATRREEDRNEGGGEGQIKAGSVALLPPPRSNFPPCQTAAGVCNPLRRRGPRFSNGCRPRPARGRLHVLRHTFCSRLAMRAATVKAVQELAGHASLMTTQRYMHLTPLRKRARSVCSSRIVLVREEIGERSRVAAARQTKSGGKS